MEPSDDSLDDCLVFYEPMPQLQDMAAFAVSLNLTLNYAKDVIIRGDVVHRENTSHSTLFHTRRNQIYATKPNNLIIPRPLEAMVKKHVTDCCNEIQQWLNFYERFASFDTRLVAVMLEFLPNIVWKSNGKIDHLRTAFDLVNTAGLNQVVKFCVMCEFCMEEKIRNSWVEVENRLSFVKDLIFRQEPLLVYWFCFMTGDFSQIAVSHITLVDERVLLNLAHRTGYFSAIEYFFNKFYVDDRTEVGAALMRKWCGWTRFLISKCGEEEQYGWFSSVDYASGILGAFTQDMSYEYLDDALQIWNRIKILLTGDQYVEILEEMNFRRYRVRDGLLEFLLEFWRTTPRHLKEYMFQLEDDEVLSTYSIFPTESDSFETYDEQFQRDDSILIAVLSDADLGYRRRFWRRHWTRIVYRSKPASLKEILDLCVSNDEMSSFKNDVMSSSIFYQYLEEIIETSKIPVLNEFLEMFIDGGQREIDDAKRDLFEEVISSGGCLAIECCEETEEYVAALIEFLRVVFGDDLEREAVFKKKFILEYVRYDEDWFQNNVTKIIYVSDRICEAALLKEVKNKVLEMCKRIVLPMNDDYRNSKLTKWNGILLWCLEDQREVEEFKNSCNYIFARNV